MARLPRAPTLHALGVDGAGGLARVLEQSRGLARPRSARAPAWPRGTRRCPPGRIPDVRSRDRRAGRRRIEVQRHRVDVAEHGRRALVQQAVRRGDEAERARHHLVAGAPAECPDPEVERRGARRDGDRVVDAEPVREIGARSAPAPGPARAVPSASPRAPAPPRARPRSGRARGRTRTARRLLRSRSSPGRDHVARRSAPLPRRAGGVRGGRWAGRRTRASRRAPPTRPR